MKAKWTDAHYQSLRQLIGAASDRELTDADYLIREASRLGLPVAALKPSSLYFAIMNACRNTPEWPRACVAKLHLSRKRDADKRAQNAAITAPDRSAKPRASAFKGHPLVDVAPRGFTLAERWTDRIGVKYIAGADIPDYVARVYVRSPVGQARMYVEDAGMERFARERQDPAKARRIEIGRNGVAVKLARKAGGPVPGPVPIATPAPVVETAPTVPPLPITARASNGKACEVRDVIAIMLANRQISPAEAVAMIAETIK